MRIQYYQAESFHLALVGCLHGQFELMYDLILGKQWRSQSNNNNNHTNNLYETTKQSQRHIIDILTNPSLPLSPSFSLSNTNTNTVPPVDAILICGDVQCTRHGEDLNSMAVLDKYKELGSFKQFYEKSKQLYEEKTILNNDINNDSNLTNNDKTDANIVTKTPSTHNVNDSSACSIMNHQHSTNNIDTTKAPILTLFIGGNHEASALLREL
jgi:hypothetical protein